MIQTECFFAPSVLPLPSSLPMIMPEPIATPLYIEEVMPNTNSATAFAATALEPMWPMMAAMQVFASIHEPVCTVAGIV